MTRKTTYEDLEKKISVLEEESITSKQAEKDLRESEHKYRILVENADESILVLQNGIVKYVNKKAEETFGYSWQEFQTTPIFEIIHPDDREQVIKRYLDKIQGNTTSSRHAYRLLHKNGQTRWAEINSVLIDWEGQPATLNLISDITKSKRAEEKLRESDSLQNLLLENIDAGIVIIDAETHLIERINKQGRKLCGSTEEQIVGQVCHCFICPTEKGCCPVTDLGQDIDNSDRMLVKADGSHLPILKSVKRIQIGGKDKLLETFVDITERKLAEDALQESENRQRMLFVHMSSGAVVYEAVDGGEDFIIKDFNKAAEKIEKVSSEEVIGKRVTQAFPGVKEFGVFEVFQRVWKTGELEYLPMAIYRDERNPVTWRESWVYKLPTGEIVSLYNDITERKQMEEALKENEKRYHMLVENANDIIYRTDALGCFTFCNHAAVKLTGYAEADLIGKHFIELISPDYRAEAEQFYGRQFVKNISNTYHEFPLVSRDKGEIWLGQHVQLLIDDGQVVGFQAIARDITETKRLGEEIREMSLRDQLTELYNRRGFLTLAEQQFKLSDRTKGKMVLFFADLDGLKWINDTLGHEEGDKAIIEATAVFKEAFRSSDIIARMGGDEFAILAIDPEELNSEIIINRLQNQIDKHNNQADRRYKLSISVGCSSYDPENPSSLDELMASADKLMYEQKKNKKSRAV